jgi:alkylation response protein AidB-like acyl-CoA dehydrogenase
MADLTDEQQTFVAAIRDFCARELKDRDRDSEPHDDAIARQMAELGWYGLQIGEEYGGSGGSFTDATLFLEETSALSSARPSARTASGSSTARRCGARSPTRRRRS